MKIKKMIRQEKNEMKRKKEINAELLIVKWEKQYLCM